MAIAENKLISGRISLRQILGLIALLAFCFLFVYFDALIVGYVVAVFALSAFYLVVAFDVGIPKNTEEQSTPE